MANIFRSPKELLFRSSYKGRAGGADGIVGIREGDRIGKDTRRRGSEKDQHNE